MPALQQAERGIAPRHYVAAIADRRERVVPASDKVVESIPNSSPRLVTSLMRLYDGESPIALVVPVGWLMLRSSNTN